MQIGNGELVSIGVALLGLGSTAFGFFYKASKDASKDQTTALNNMNLSLNQVLVKIEKNDEIYKLKFTHVQAEHETMKQDISDIKKKLEHHTDLFQNMKNSN